MVAVKSVVLLHCQSSLVSLILIRDIQIPEIIQGDSTLFSTHLTGNTLINLFRWIQVKQLVHERVKLCDMS